MVKRIDRGSFRLSCPDLADVFIGCQASNGFKAFGEVVGHQSRRGATKRFGVPRNTIPKMLSFSVPPRDFRREQPASKKLGPHIPSIDAILEGDRQLHKKQRHTAHRIFERLRDEQGEAPLKLLAMQVEEEIATMLLD